MESANMAGRNVQTYTLENKNTLRKLATLRNEGQLCDLMFIFPDGSQIEAHKAIVCQYSSVIKARCVDIDQHKLQVLCTDIDNEQAINPSILNIMLDYIYGLSITIRQEYIQDIMRLAIKLNIPEFLGDCDKILFENKALGPSDLMINAQNIKQEQTGSGYETGQASDFGMADQPLVTPSTSFDDTNLQEPIDEKAAKPPGRRKRKATKVVKANVEQLPEPQSDEEDDMMDNPLDDDTDEYEADNFTAIKAEEADSDYNESASPKKRKRSKAKKTTVSTKRSHQKKTATLDPLFCKECDQKFDAYKDAAEHHKGVHNLIVCDVCAKIFDNEADLRRHSVLHSEGLLILGDFGEFVYKCLDSECDKIFNNTTLWKPLRRHMNEKHGKELFECTKCQKQFPLYFRYTSHVLHVHQGVKRSDFKVSVPCEICGKVVLRERMMAHNKTFHWDKIEKCELCGKTFQCEQYLKLHMETHSDKLYLCTVCGKSFQRNQSLLMHINIIHLGAKKFSCPTCDMKFKYREQLQNHYINQPMCVPYCVEKGYQCNICGKFCTSDAHLKLHEARVHNNIRYKCMICNKKFLRAKELNFHIKKIHEKPFQCSYCGKRFGTRGFLKTHSYTHTGEKPFTCELCGVSFAGSGTLYRHKQGKSHLDNVNRTKYGMMGGYQAAQPPAAENFVQPESEISPHSLATSSQRESSVVRDDLVTQLQRDRNNTQEGLIASLQRERNIGQEHISSPLQRERDVSQEDLSASLLRERNIGQEHFSASLQHERNIGQEHFTASLQRERNIGQEDLTASFQPERNIGQEPSATSLQRERNLGQENIRQDLSAPIQRERNISQEHLSASLHHERNIGQENISQDLSASFQRERNIPQDNLISSLHHESNVAQHNLVSTLQRGDNIVNDNLSGP